MSQIFNKVNEKNVPVFKMWISYNINLIINIYL